MAKLRQKLLFPYSQNPGLDRGIGAWTVYDATGQETHTAGDSDAVPELPRPDADRLQGRNSGRRPPRALALRAAEPDGSPPLYVQAAHQPDRAPAPPLEHG